MRDAALEHVNITVTDANATAQTLCDLFGWRVRWSGAVTLGGYSVHVGNDESYIALYSPAGDVGARRKSSYGTAGAMNHIGVTVADLDATENRVREKGFEPYMHADYAPGRRFYFRNNDGIEIEVVSYAGQGDA